MLKVLTDRPLTGAKAENGTAGVAAAEGSDRAGTRPLKPWEIWLKGTVPLASRTAGSDLAGSTSTWFSVRGRASEAQYGVKSSCASFLIRLCHTWE
jgi:hypothetical protein